jgi:hypothetical protein
VIYLLDTNAITRGEILFGLEKLAPGRRRAEFDQRNAR